MPKSLTDGARVLADRASRPTAHGQARRRRALGLLSAAAGLALAPSALLAFPATFNGNDSVGNIGDNATFNDPNNWTTNGVVDTAPNTTVAPGDDLTFGSGTATAAVLDLGTNRIANSLTFVVGYTLGTAATALTLTNSSGSVTVNTGITGTINAVLAGTNGLSLSGGGTLLLNRSTGNTFTGNIVVDGTVAGTTLAYLATNSSADPTALGAGSNKTITLQNGGIVSIAGGGTSNPTAGSKQFVIGTGGGTIDTPGANGLQLDDAGQFSGSGNLTKTGAGLLFINNQVYAYTGSTININGGILRTGANTGVLGTGTLNLIVSNGATFDNQVVLAGTKTVTVSGTGSASLAGALVTSAGNGTVGNVTLAADASLGGNGNLTVGAIGDGGSGFNLTKVGTGALILTAAPTYSGTTAVNGGAFRVGTNSAFLPANNITLNGGAIEVGFNYSPTLGTAAGQVNIAGGSSGFSSNTNTTNGAAVTISVNGGATLAFGSTPNFNPSALVLNQATANGPILLTNSLDLNGATRTITVNSALGTNTATLSGAVVNNGTAVAGLTKNGTGVLILPNAGNSYAGTTTVSAGVLRANDGVGLPVTSNLLINGGVFETGANLTRAIGTGSNQVQITGGTSGFSANGTAGISVDLGGDGTGTGPQLTFGQTGFNPSTLVLNEVTANNTLNFRNSLNLGNGTAVVARAINVNANAATLSGFLTQTSGTAGAGITKGGTGTLVLANTTNNFTGTLTFGAGIVNVASLSDYGVPSAIGARTFAQESAASNDIIGLHFTGGALQYTGSTPQSTNRQIRISTNGATIDASGNGTNATLSFTGASGTNINLFDTAGARTLTLTGSNAGTNTFAIQLTDQATNGATSLVKSGLGTWILAATNNTFTGGVTVSSGNLRVTNSAALGTGTKTITIIPTVNPTSFPGLQLDGSAGNIVLPSTFSFTTSYDALNGTTPIAGQGAIVNIAGSNTIAGNFSLTSGGGGTTILVNAGTLTLSGNFTPSTTARNLNSRGNGNTIFSGIIANGSTVGMPFNRNSGTGITTLTNNNTYTGITTVSSGTLLVNGSNGTVANGQGNYVINAADGLGGATLGGTGLINLTAGASVTLNGTPSAVASNNATFSPGPGLPGQGAAGVGTFTVAAGTAAASVNFGSNSTFAVDLGPGNLSDRLTLTGASNNLTIAGRTSGASANFTDTLALTTVNTGTFTVANFGGTQSGVFDFVTLNGVNDPGTFSVSGSQTTFNANDGSLSVLYDDTAAKDIVVTVNAIPEPATGLLLLPAFGLLARRKRRPKRGA